MNPHSLELLEFPRVSGWIAGLAACEPAREALRAWPPEWSRAWRERENAVLAEALRRSREPGVWCDVPEGELGSRLEPEARETLDGPGLRVVLAWLESARITRELWSDDETAARHSRLCALARSLPVLEALRERIAAAIEPDGRVSDAASPALRRARAELATGERELERQLERWARGFGENAYVTRHGERFVALVPAAGFSRKKGIVHDVSGSGQSLFVEPVEACESNNRLLELRASALEEERRILRELAEEVLAGRDALGELERSLAHLDTLRARSRWAAEIGAIALEPGGSRLKITAARHPLLIRRGAADVVPLDLELGDEGRLLLVSGPNMGGKTVLLKTVGLVAALAHAAMPVPAAEGSALPELDGILVDLGDEQSVDEGLSTFAAHLRALGAMERDAGPRCLILCDELGAGTDPDEGLALGRALLERFAARGAWGVLTTHYGGLKRAATEIPGVVNGSLEFDEATFTSRFRFLPGVPGASHALRVAERLGFSADVLARARALTPESARAIEQLLASLQEARRKLDDERAALAAATAAATEAEARHREATEHARRTLEQTRLKLTRESEAVLANARELWQTVRREAKRADKSRATADAVRAGIESAEHDVARLQSAADEALAATGFVPAPRTIERLEIGQRVRIADLGVEAEVVKLPDAEGRVLLRRGGWSIQSHVSRLVAASEGAGTAADAASGARVVNGPTATWEAPEEAPGLDVDLRGHEVDEALAALDQALDRAVISGLSELRIVHGVGRGVLRAAVERHLRGHPQVLSQRLGQVGEGGRGVTIARLR